jgi:hypothetical protein
LYPVAIGDESDQFSVTLAGPVELELDDEAPVPVSDTVCVLLLALSVMVSVPLSELAVVGVKVTLMLQLLPAASELPQALLAAKLPVAATELIVKAALPELVSVTVWALLVVFTVWLAKLRLLAERLAAGEPDGGGGVWLVVVEPEPLPLALMASEGFDALLVTVTVPL